jgi:hypothetical protein
MERISRGTVMNGVGKGHWATLAFGLVVVLEGVIGVSGQAQSNTQKDVPFAKLLDDRGVRYPLVVDPWIQQGELTASDGAAQDELGNSVAVSGNMAVVGSPDHTFGKTFGQGAAYVFVESGRVARPCVFCKGGM